MPSKIRKKFQAFIMWSVALASAAIGVFGWAFFGSIFLSEMSREPGVHDEGANNLGPGISFAIYGGLTLIGSMIAGTASLIASSYHDQPALSKILGFAVKVNGILIGLAVLVALYLAIFPI